MHTTGDRHNWSMENISKFEREESDIHFITQNNITCLHNHTTACDRIIIDYIPTSYEHHEKRTKICTLFDTFKKCSQEFAVEIIQGTLSKCMGANIM